jgi:hypothetical protein
VLADIKHKFTMNLTFSATCIGMDTTTQESLLRQAPVSPLYFHIQRLVKNSTAVESEARPVNQRLFQKKKTMQSLLSDRRHISSLLEAGNFTEPNVIPPEHGYSAVEHKWTEFNLDAPAAKSVKLAADFTDWGKFPLELTRSESGFWFIHVPLCPGTYSYRFIVDDEWLTDQSTKCADNLDDPTDAVINVL